MKRINPDTGKTFKRRDKRPSCDIQDDKLFASYKKIIKKNGFYIENWAAPEYFDELILKNKQNRERAKRLGSPKRMNPETNKPFVMGDRASDGSYFLRYRASIKKETGYLRERWGDIDAYIKRLMGSAIIRIKKKCKNKNLPFNIDIDYVMSIYPKDYRCPILGFKFVYGTKEEQKTHSIDRIVPSKGYVKGNIIIVSKIANQIKSSATPDQLMKVANFYLNLGSS